MSREGREVQIEAITGEQRQTIMGQKPLQGVDEQMRRMLCAGTQMQHGQKRACRGRWPATARAPGWSCEAVCEFHLTGGAECAGCGRSAHGRAQRACLPE